MKKRIRDGFRDSLVFYKGKISGRKSGEMVKSDCTNSSKMLTNGKLKVMELLVHAQSGLKGPQETGFSPQCKITRSRKGHFLSEGAKHACWRLSSLPMCRADHTWGSLAGRLLWGRQCLVLLLPETHRFALVIFQVS